MISAALYATLDTTERKLWHSHVFEVKSGMLIMPGPTNALLQRAWETAETTEMEDVVTLYGKIYHLWQTDRGDKLPLGEPKLMTSFTEQSQFEGMEAVLDERDERFGVDWKHKRGLREYIKEPEIHEDADQTWKQGKV